MKKKLMKLSLKKETIAKLNNKEMKKIEGGATASGCPTYCSCGTCGGEYTCADPPCNTAIPSYCTGGDKCCL